MYNFLGRFPTTTYNSQESTNIMVKIALDKVIQKSAAVFYPYVVREGERPDTIAADYYGDARYAWLIYMSSSIMDPYYEWPLDSNQFKAFIEKKYGSIAVASQQIAFWRNNWYGDDSIISSSQYEALPSYARKYWDSLDNSFSAPASYARKKADYTVDTNKIVSITMDNSGSVQLSTNVYQYTNSEITGSGYVMENSDNTIVVKDVLGTFISGSLYSNSSTVIGSATSINTVITSIPDTESAYWHYVTKYDYEEELNESRKHIQIIDRRYIDTIESELNSLV